MHDHRKGADTRRYGRPAERDELPAVDQCEPGETGRSRAECDRERSEDLPVGVRELAAQQRDDRDQSGDAEQRRRPDPEEPAKADVDRHADAVVCAFFSAFCAMNFSVASYASSSTICTGGDFIR